MTKGTKKKIIIDVMEKVKTNELAEIKSLYLKAMYDLDHAGVITFLDRDLIGESVGVGRPFASFTALGENFGFLAAELSNIRIGAQTNKSARIRIMLKKLEEIKRNES